MKKLLSAVFALALGTMMMAGCSESRSDRVGERPGTDRAPSASPSTVPPARSPDATTGSSSSSDSGAKTTPPSDSNPSSSPPATTPPPSSTTK